jgi:hypothetical protein
VSPTLYIDFAPTLAPARVVLLACWAWLAWQGARALPAVARWEGERARLRDAALALAALGVALRLGLAPLTPEMRWRLFWSFAAEDSQGVEELQKYGLAWPQLVRLAVDVVGKRYEVPFVLNGLLGGAAVLPMVGLVRAVGGSASAALWSGACLAVTPLLVWFGHTDAPFPLDALSTLLTLWATARYARASDAPDARWLGVAVCAFVTSAQCRIESASTGALALGLAVALGDRALWRRREPWLAAAAAVALLVPHALLVAPKVAHEVQQRAAEAPEQYLWRGLPAWLVLNRTMQAEALIALLPFGLLLGPVRPSVRVWAFAAMIVTSTTVSDVAPTHTAFSVARYQLRALPFAALLAGLGASALTAGRARGPVGALLALGLAAGLDKATTVSVMKRENDFFRAHIGDVDTPCTLVSWLMQDDAGLFVPMQLSELAGRDHTWMDLGRPDLPTSGCLVYYRSSGCTNHYRFDERVQGVQNLACAAFEARWRLEPIAVADLEADPVGPMGVPNYFPDAPIPVGFFRVLGPADAQPTP